jgi:hypothetical protein
VRVRACACVRVRVRACVCHGDAALHRDAALTPMHSASPQAHLPATASASQARQPEPEGRSVGLVRGRGGGGPRNAGPRLKAVEPLERGAVNGGGEAADAGAAVIVPA